VCAFDVQPAEPGVPVRADLPRGLLVLRVERRGERDARAADDGVRQARFAGPAQDRHDGEYVNACICGCFHGYHLANPSLCGLIGENSQPGCHYYLRRLDSLHDLLGQVWRQIVVYGCRSLSRANERSPSLCCALGHDSMALAVSHAILRDCPTVRDEDELGFLSDEGAKIADTV
jgi:hypothetical protein